jgi:NADPH:quinone reductase-like Zn-dependent oxidoreductase
MRAVVIHSFGPPSTLRVEERPEPAPGPGEVRVAVRAIGVNFADVLSRLGVYAAAPDPPFIPGIEVAGEVDATGEGVGRFAVGERVAGFCPFGAYAEKVVVPAPYMMRLAEGIGFEEGAAIPVQYLTAWYGLEQLARVEAGETVLIHAAAGGTGRAAVELAREAGARIVATVGSPEKAEIVRAAAPEARVILYREEELGRALEREPGGGRLDVVMDSVGGKVFRAGWKRLAPGGRYVLFGAAAAVQRGALSRLGALWRLLPMLAVNPLSMITSNRSLLAFNLFFLADRRTELLHSGMERILALREQGAIRPEIGLTLPLERAAEAHERLQGRETHGKVVLTVP